MSFTSDNCPSFDSIKLYIPFTNSNVTTETPLRTPLAEYTLIPRAIGPRNVTYNKNSGGSAVAEYVAGPVFNAMFFDGRGSILMTNPVSSTPSVGYTISFWENTGPTTSQPIFNLNTSDGSAYFGTALALEKDASGCMSMTHSQNGAGFSTYRLQDPSTIVDNVWQHWTIVYDVFAGTLTTYQKYYDGTGTIHLSSLTVGLVANVTSPMLASANMFFNSVRAAAPTTLVALFGTPTFNSATSFTLNSSADVVVSQQTLSYGAGSGAVLTFTQPTVISSVYLSVGIQSIDDSIDYSFRFINGVGGDTGVFVYQGGSQLTRLCDLNPGTTASVTVDTTGSAVFAAVDPSTGSQTYTHSLGLTVLPIRSFSNVSTGSLTVVGFSFVATGTAGTGLYTTGSFCQFALWWDATLSSADATTLFALQSQATGQAMGPNLVPSTTGFAWPSHVQVYAPLNGGAAGTVLSGGASVPTVIPTGLITTLVGGGSTCIDGNIAPGMLFAPGVSGYVDITSVGFGTSTTSYLTSVWVRYVGQSFTGSTGYSILTSLQDASGNFWTVFVVVTGLHTHAINIVEHCSTTLGDAGANTYVATNPIDLNNGSWRHISIYRDAGTGIYVTVDGKSEPVLTTGGSFVPPTLPMSDVGGQVAGSTNTIRIGQGTNGSNSFDGAISQFIMWTNMGTLSSSDRALAMMEIYRRQLGFYMEFGSAYETAQTIYLNTQLVIPIKTRGLSLAPVVEVWDKNMTTRYTYMATHSIGPTSCTIIIPGLNGAGDYAIRMSTDSYLGLGYMPIVENWVSENTATVALAPSLFTQNGSIQTQNSDRTDRSVVLAGDYTKDLIGIYVNSRASGLQLDPNAMALSYFVSGATTTFANYSSSTGLMDMSNLGQVQCITTVQLSDRNLKTNIQDFTDGLSVVNQLRPVSFTWRNHGSDSGAGEDIGFIAQEIESILPEIVRTTATGYKGVQYDRLATVLVNSVNELTAKLSTVTGQVALLTHLTFDRSLISTTHS